VRAGFVSLGASIVILAVKLAAYLYTGSMALLADAAESSVNVIAASVMTFSVAVSRRPPDADHPYGHGKAEPLSAAVEGAPGMRANLLMPGLIDTSLGRLASAASPLRDRVKIPAGRQGTAWEIAYAAVFLLSSESSYVTGQSLIVDGGLTSGPRA